MYSIYSKSLLFTSISYVQEGLKLNKRNQSWIKLLFCIGDFPLTNNIMFLGGANNVLQPSVKKFVHSGGLWY